MTGPKKTKSLCIRCRNNHYNQSEANGCSLFNDAIIKQRMIVGTFESPPYSKDRLGPMLLCYLPEKQSVIEADDPRIT